MNKSRRYKTDGLLEDQYENGSEGLVLKNFLHIKDKPEIEKIEIKELYRVTEELTETFDAFCGGSPRDGKGLSAHGSVF